QARGPPSGRAPCSARRPSSRKTTSLSTAPGSGGLRYVMVGCARQRLRSRLDPPDPTSTTRLSGTALWACHIGEAEQLAPTRAAERNREGACWHAGPHSEA